MSKKWKFDVWTIVSIAIMGLFILCLLYPMIKIFRLAVLDSNGHFTMSNFITFFSKPYYSKTILNSLKLAILITFFSLAVGIPLSYCYSFYILKGAKMIFILSILCCMSAPFIGAYAWILLLGRSGVLTVFLERLLHIKIGSIYGLRGIVLVETLKLFPLVFIYMNGAFKNIDNSLLEASANLGCVGIKRVFKVTLRLCMPTILAASLLVFMRSFADFGTPLLLGEGFRTFPVEIYNQYLGENGTDFHFAATISVIAIIITALVFALQKWGTNKFKFSINALHPVQKKKPGLIRAIIMNAYCYIVIAFSFLPQLYVIFLSFKKCDMAVFKPGFSLDSYKAASRHLLSRSLTNSLVISGLALAIIILLSIFIAYLVVRRPSLWNNMIDTISMIPYIIPGAVIGIALVIAFSNKPLALTGTMIIMVMSFVIRRMPYTIRSATANLMQIPMSIEEASISLGTSKLKTFRKVTVPMMTNGILSGAILSWVSLVTELSSSIILYNNSTITLTMSAYVSIAMGNYGMACAFSSILTVLTFLSLLLYLKISGAEDIKM
ncbi:MAG: iron ABC transporter permease [Treponema sp.]|nr:iron ABC transporter permease [Treponema sp.]